MLYSQPDTALSVTLVVVTLAAVGADEADTVRLSVVTVNAGPAGEASVVSASGYLAQKEYAVAGDRLEKVDDSCHDDPPFILY